MNEIKRLILKLESPNLVYLDTHTFKARKVSDPKNGTLKQFPSYTVKGIVCMSYKHDSGFINYHYITMSPLFDIETQVSFLNTEIRIFNSKYNIDLPQIK